MFPSTLYQEERLAGRRCISATWATTENKGIELLLNTVNILSKNFNWKTGLTLALQP